MTPTDETKRSPFLRVVLDTDPANADKAQESSPNEVGEELWLVPGAIDQYISRSTFELLYPGEKPAATKPAK